VSSSSCIHPSLEWTNPHSSASVNEKGSACVLCPRAQVGPLTIINQHPTINTHSSHTHSSTPNHQHPFIPHPFIHTHESMQVTHLIAKRLSSSLQRFFSERRPGSGPFVVTESWLLESARAKCRLPEAHYALTQLKNPRQPSFGALFAQSASAAATGETTAAPPPPPPPSGCSAQGGCGDGLGRGGEARWGWKGGEIRVEPSVSPGREKAPMPPVVHGTNDGKTLVVHGTDGGKNGVSIPWGDRQTKSRRCRLRNLTRLSHVHLSLRRDEHTGAPPFSPAQISQLRDWSPALAPLTDFEMVKI
jgi:hypothetical protein